MTSNGNLLVDVLERDCLIDDCVPEKHEVLENDRKSLVDVPEPQLILHETSYVTKPPRRRKGKPAGPS